jgi:hypothetical protein
MAQIGVLVRNPRPASRTLQAVLDQAPPGWLRRKVRCAAADRHV